MGCRARIGAGLVAGLSIAIGARAQNAAPAPIEKPAAETSSDEGRERLREVLQRRREMAEATRTKLDDALARLERGEPIEAVREEAFRELSDARLDVPGEGGRAGMRDERPDRPGARERVRDGQGEPGFPGSGTPDETRRMRAFVEKHLPMLAERLRHIETDDPDGPGRMLGRLGPRLRAAMEVEERSPELFAVRVAELQQSFQLIEAGRRVRRVIETEGAESEGARQARERFRALASEHYDTQVKMQEMEIADLERKIAEMRAEIDRKVTNRDHEIDARLEELLRSVGREEGRRGPGERRPGRGRGDDQPRKSGPQ